MCGTSKKKNQKAQKTFKYNNKNAIADYKKKNKKKNKHRSNIFWSLKKRCQPRLFGINF